MQMIFAAINHLSERGAKVLRCYVEPDNIPSRNLQISIGFSEMPFKTFNNFINDGEIMYEIEIPNSFTLIPATINEAYFFWRLFVQNKDVLNSDDISLSKWKELLSVEDPDEMHFLICKGAMPVAYMKLNGLLNKNEAWISMLFVAKDFQRQGTGTYAIKQAERYLKTKGFKTIHIKTTADNLPAQTCYLKCGYEIYSKNAKIEFRKEL